MAVLQVDFVFMVGVLVVDVLAYASRYATWRNVYHIVWLLPSVTRMGH